MSDGLKGARVVVIGAGVIGACAALRCAQAGARVTIVERLYPGAGTSGNSFASLGSFAQLPRHFHELHVRSFAEHVALARELDGDWLHVSGALRWVNEDQAGSAAFYEEVERERSWSGDVAELTPEAAMRVAGGDVRIDASRVKRVFLLSREGWIGGVQLAHAAVRAACERHDARFVRATVAAVPTAGGRVTGIRLDDGSSIAADFVVNAAGPDAARVAALAGVRLAVGRRTGALVITEPSPIRLRHVLRAPETHVHPDGGGRLIFYHGDYGAGVPEGTVIPADDALGRRAIADALPLLPGLAGIRAEAIRLGIRAEPADGVPVLGGDGIVEGLYTVVSRSGVILSAIFAQIVRAELSSGPSADGAPYRPTPARWAPVSAAAT